MKKINYAKLLPGFLKRQNGQQKVETPKWEGNKSLEGTLDGYLFKMMKSSAIKKFADEEQNRCDASREWLGYERFNAPNGKVYKTPELYHFMAYGAA
jgi:hypothetical protein